MFVWLLFAFLFVLWGVVCLGVYPRLALDSQPSCLPSLCESWENRDVLSHLTIVTFKGISDLPVLLQGNRTFHSTTGS